MPWKIQKARSGVWARDETDGELPVFYHAVPVNKELPLFQGASVANVNGRVRKMSFLFISEAEPVALTEEPDSCNNDRPDHLWVNDVLRLKGPAAKKKQKTKELIDFSNIHSQK